MRLTTDLTLAALLAFTCLSSCTRFVSPSHFDARVDDASAPDVMTSHDATPDAAVAPWSRGFSDGLDMIGLDMAVSRGGQVAVVGAFRQTVDFGVGPITTRQPYDREFFVVVFDANGRAIWSRPLRGLYSLGNYQPFVAFAGEDLVVAGSFDAAHPLDVGHGPLVGPGHASVFATRFDTTGREIWTQLFGNADGLYVLDLAANATGEVFMCGRYYGATQLGAWSYTGGTSISDNTFVLKFGADGTPLAAASVPVTGVSYSRIAVSPAGNVSLIGALLGTANFGVANITVTGRYGLFAAGFDSSLHPTFARGIGIKSDEIEESLFDVAVDTGGNVLIAAWSTGPIDLGGDPLFSDGAYGSYLLKLDARGNRLWDRVWGPAMEMPRIAIDTASEIRVTSTVRGSLDLGLGALSGPDAGYAFVLAAYDATGTIQTNRIIDYAPIHNSFVSLAAASNADIVLMGAFGGTLDLGTGQLHSASWSQDLLVARIAFPGGGR